MQLKYFMVAILVTIVAGCAPPQPPVAQNFIYTPPGSASPIRGNMGIAIIAPSPQGSFFSRQYANSNSNYPAFFHAALNDMEKVLIAKGFTVTGTFPTTDEMTFSDKERATLIMRPEILSEIAISRGLLGAPSSATISGSVTLDFSEPMSHEKIWVKRFEVPPITQPVALGLVIDATGHLMQNPDGSPAFALTKNSETSLLNAFYQAVFDKTWQQIDSRELLRLKGDADRVKARTNFRGN